MADEVNSQLSTPADDLQSSSGSNVNKTASGFQGNDPPGLPPEPFAFASNVPFGSGVEDVGSVSESSYSIEYSAINGRNEIRNLLADTFQINNNNNDQPSPGPSFPVPEEVNDNEFFSIDTRPVIASDVGEERTDSGSNYASTIDSYTSFLSRPDLWRPTDGGMFEVAGITDLKHYSFLPPQETRMAEANWPGTQVGIATGIISKDDPTKITNVVVSFNTQPTTCNGVSPGYTVVYEGDLVHDDDKAATATNGYIQRNTRIKIKDGTTYTLNKSHTYTGTVGIAHTFKVRRIGPSKINREYGYYSYHYYVGEGVGPTSPEDFKLTKEYTSEYSYAYYYGKKPDGTSKTGSSALGAAGVDGNTSRYTAYNVTGRWGVYIDAEVKNYFEGRTFIGHNQGIGVGAVTATINGNANTKVQPDPILSVFNNRFKNQLGELDIGSTSCPGTQVSTHGDYSFDQYQMGLYVEDIAAIGTRPDIRYRLSVDGTTTGAGILGKFTGITSTRAASFKGAVDVSGTLTATTLSGSISGSNITGSISGSLISGNISGNAASATNISNSGTVTLATATESNSIYITQPSYTTDQPVKLLNFDWYGNVWSLGNIRSGSTPSNGFGVYATGTERARFTTSGLTVVGTVTQTSDIKLKTNIKTLTNSLEKVLQMRGVEFDRIDLEGNHQIGVIAQEIEAVVPELVSENGGTKSVAYGNITALLIEAIKEQQEHIKTLETKVKELDTRLKDLL